MNYQGVKKIALFVLIFAISWQIVSAREDDIAAIQEVLLRNAAAFEKNDLALAEKLWANDDSVVVFENGHANFGWLDYKNNHLGPEMADMAEMKNIRFELSDIKIKTVSTLGYATFRYKISADQKDRHVEGSGLGTAVLEQRGENWLIVHWHSSNPRK
ncbi:MAG TPA: nuclear transport factor 2 family protein [Acidobacteriota bacterium]|nr:nuclear transport factor 2 family protein [Acidobacteriota bacterium]